MSHDHEAVELAIVALDFELTPDERSRMDDGLLACPACVEIVAGHADLARLLQRLPVRDASPYVRERVLRRALVPPRTRQWPVLLAAAAMLMLLFGVAAAAGAFRESPPIPPAIALPSAAPPALGDVVTESPSTAPDASPQPGDGPGGPAYLGTPLDTDTIATVVSPRLRVRSEPRVAADSIKFEPLLDVGDRLLILAGPVVANDYAWYQVSAWRPGQPGRSWPVGWVARGDHEGSPWIDPAVDPCPSDPITIATVVAMVAEERVACLEDRPLRLRTFVSGGPDLVPCTPQPSVACVDGPVWLAGDGGWTAEVDADGGPPSLGGPPLRLLPGGPVAADAMPASAMVDLDGAFGHPDADGCRPGRVGPGSSPLTVAEARLACRARFVVTGISQHPDDPASGAMGITVSPNLRVRSAPGLASARRELLREGTSVWVVGGPVVEADFEWFQVIVPTIDAGDGAPRVGWVAASDHGAERWLARRPSTCPDPGSLRIADLVRLTGPEAGHGGDALACFGATTLRFRGTVQLRCGVQGRPGWDASPEWLGPNASHQLALRDGEAVVPARPHPTLGVPLACDPLDDAERSIEAHFDDPAAAGCDAAPRGRSGPPDLVVVAVHWCRTTLVVDRLVPMPVPFASAPPG